MIVVRRYYTNLILSFKYFKWCVINTKFCEQDKSEHAHNMAYTFLLIYVYIYIINSGFNNSYINMLVVISCLR